MFRRECTLLQHSERLADNLVLGCIETGKSELLQLFFRGRGLLFEIPRRPPLSLALLSPPSCLRRLGLGPRSLLLLLTRRCLWSRLALYLLDEIKHW